MFGTWDFKGRRFLKIANGSGKPIWNPSMAKMMIKKTSMLESYMNRIPTCS